MKKFTNKKYALSIVALILVLLMTIGITYSWIDDVKLVEINTSDDGTDIPLKTGVDINSTATIKDQRTITATNKTINLGKVLSEAEENDFVGKNLTQAQKETINKKKGYLYESGDMHFSGCYSDGESFYFPINDTTSYYREGNIDDENVNYIDVTLKVNSPDANVDFWFENVPTITDNNGKAIENARYSITVDGRRNIYSSTGEAQTVRETDSNLTPVSGVRKTAKYTYGNSNNKDNANTLFSIKKGSSVNLNVKIWVEGNISANIESADINMSLVSSWAYTHNITIIDKTSSCGITTSSSQSPSWLGNGDAKMFWTFPALLNAKTTTKANWQNSTYKNQGLSGDLNFSTVTDTSGTYRKCTITNVPLVYNNEDMMIYRDNSWNQGSKTDAYYGVKCYNWWYTNIPNSYVNCEYTLYGGSHDEYASRYFKDDPKKETNQGYGTWGELEKIQVDPQTKSLNKKNLAPKINGDGEDSVLSKDYYLAGTFDGVDVGINDNYNKYYQSYKFDKQTGTITITFRQTSYVIVRTGDTSNALYMTDNYETGTSAKLSKKENGEKLGVEAGTYIFKLVENGSDTLTLSYGDNGADFYICDYSDYDATEELYIHGMSYNSTNKLWEAYVPKSSTLLQFYYHKKDTNDGSSYWGYNSWDGVNPQQRPQGITKYYLTQCIEESHNGIGYWENANNVYLIANGTAERYSTFYANMYKTGSSSRMVMSRTTSTYGSKGYKVYVSNSTQNAGDWHHLKFDNGTQSYGNESAELIMCPGCYFDWENNKWLGSLTGTDRSPSSSGGGDTGGSGGGGGTGGDTGGGGNTGSMSGYNTQSSYYLKDDKNVKTYFYTKSGSNDYKASIKLTTTTQYFTIQHTSGKQYGVGNYSEYTAPYTNGINVYTGNIKSFGLKATKEGNYIVTFVVDNQTLHISTILPEG